MLFVSFFRTAYNGNDKADPSGIFCKPIPIANAMAPVKVAPALPTLVPRRRHQASPCEYYVWLRLRITSSSSNNFLLSESPWS